MISLNTPQQLTGTTDQKFNQLYSYLFQTSNKLNMALSNLSVENIWKQTSEALATANSANASLDTSEAISGYQAIKNLIVKTADYALLSMEQMTVNLNSDYQAVSDYGKFLEKASVTINGNAYGITQLYNYTANLSSEYHDYTTDTSQYIKTGLLYHDGATPKYGLEIGILSNNITVDGVFVPFINTYKTRITADRWSLYSDHDEVLYISGTAAYMPNAVITGGSLNINNVFTVDSLGRVNAQAGTISRWNIYTYRLSYGTLGNVNSAFLAVTDVGTTIAETARSDWRMGVGSKFGVTSDGYLYAINANIRGAIFATSGSFTNCIINNTCAIGNWTVKNGAIVSGKTSINSDAEGVYIGADGLCIGNASAGFKVTRYGYVTCNSIVATGGQIGAWSINSAYLGSSIGGNAFYISSAWDSDGMGSNYWISAFSGGSRKFSVSKAGKIYAVAGSVGGCNIVNERLVVDMAYVTGTLTGNNIAADTITSYHILGKTITAAEIAGNTITGAEIAAGTITSNEINTSSISAAIATMGYVTASTVAATYVTSSYLSANYITASGISAEYATITNLNSATARISTIESNYITASYVSAGYATITSLNAAVSRIGAIESDYITTTFLATKYINVSGAATIGGFTIGASSLKCGSYGTYCVMQSVSSSSGTAFAAGSTSQSDYTNANFRVTMGGTLYATGAVISGDITSNNATITGGNIKLTAPTKSTPRLSIRYNNSNYMTAFPRGVSIRDDGYDNVALGSDGTAGFLSLRNAGTSSVFISGNTSATSYINGNFAVKSVFSVETDDNNYVAMNGGTINIVKDGQAAAIVSGTGVITATVRLQSGSSSLGTGMIQLGYGLDGYIARPHMRFTHGSSNGYLWMDRNGNLKYRKNGLDITIA